MSKWRLARSLVVLREQLNSLSPNRSKGSDGTIGDADHASRSSDHNPWVRDGKTGIVTALDLTHDPAHGVNSERLAEALLASRDPRIKYVISNRKIASGAAGPKPWEWRPYKGKNAHNHHVHISVREAKSLYDADDWWNFQLGVTAAQSNKPVSLPKNPLLVIGNKGPDVERLQRALNQLGADLTVDAHYGERTEKAVKSFQRTHGLVVDGKAGPQVWEALQQGN